MEKNSEGVDQLKTPDFIVKLHNVFVEFIDNIDRRLSSIESRVDTLEKVVQNYSQGWPSATKVGKSADDIADEMRDVVHAAESSEYLLNVVTRPSEEINAPSAQPRCAPPKKHTSDVPPKPAKRSTKNGKPSCSHTVPTAPLQRASAVPNESWTRPVAAHAYPFRSHQLRVICPREPDYLPHVTEEGRMRNRLLLVDDDYLPATMPRNSSFEQDDDSQKLPESPGNYFLQKGHSRPWDK